MSSSSVRQRYLERYAEPEAQAFLLEAGMAFIADEVEQVFVLPAYDESIESLSKFLDMPTHQGLLSIWVINAPSGGEEEPHSRTKQVLSHFVETLQAQPITSNCHLAKVTTDHYLLLVDRCSDGSSIDPKQGVGLARKIGADICVALFRGNAKVKWMHFCDADVILPNDYFKPVSEVSGTSLFNVDAEASALIYPFRHVAAKDLSLESALYDFRLRYYVEQLAHAKSPYAYHALGSTMVVNLDDYCKVRGVPKRPAGEDFYLLNKLAKQKGVVSLAAPDLLIEGRESQRVPFGTGPALLKIAEHRDALRDYRYYHPESFKELGRFLSLLNNTASQASATEFVPRLKRAISDHDFLSEVTASLRFERFLSHCEKQRAFGDKALAAFHDWFDAFVSLKFVHVCRSLGYDDLPLVELIDHGAELSVELHAQHDAILKYWSA